MAGPEDWGAVPAEATTAPQPVAEPVSWGAQPVAAEPASNPQMVRDIVEANPRGYFGRIVDAFKSGAEEGYGTEAYGLSDADQKWLRDSRNEVFKSFADHVLIPGVAYLDSLSRTPNSIYHAVGDALLAAGLPRDFVAMAGGEHAYGSPHLTGRFRKATPADYAREAEKLPPGLPKLPEPPGPPGSPGPSAPPSELSPIERVFRAQDLGVIGPEKSEPTVGQSPHEMAEQAYPHDLSSASTPEAQREKILGHKPGEYDVRGKEWIDKIDAPEDVRNAVEKIAADHDFFPEARGGVASPAARDAVAQAAGVDASEIDASHFSTHFDNDGKVRAVIQVLRQTAQDVVETADRQTKEPSVENAAALTEAQLRHAHVIEYTMGLRAESGRSLAAWKDLLRQTERSKARVAIKADEQTGKVTPGTSAVVDAANDVIDNLKNPEKAGGKLGIQKLIDQAKELVGKEDETSGNRSAPLDPDVQSLVGEARKVLNEWGGAKDSVELDSFRRELERLSSGDGKIGDTVEAARALLKKNEKPETKTKPKSPSERGRLIGAAKRLIQASDNIPTLAQRSISAAMQTLMETTRQAIGRIKTGNLSQELTEFRNALGEKDIDRAVAAANRLVASEEKRAASAPKPPVEHDTIMAAARRVAKAAADETAAKEKPSLPPDVVSVLDEAKNAVSELQKANDTELGKLIDVAERNAVNMTKQKAVKNPVEALPPELQALVDKTQRVVNRFGGIARGEKAAMLLARTGRTVAEQERLARSVVGLTPNQVAKVLEKLRNSPEANKPGWFYWLWQQGLISGLITHTKYLAVNTAMIFAERVVSPLLGAVIGKARGQNVSLSAPLYANIAMVHALPDAVTSAAEAFRTGNRVPLASEMRLFERGEESPQTKGASAAYMQSNAPEWGIWKRVFNEDQLDSAARVLGIPGRSANMIHTFYKVLSEQAAASTRAYETAHAEGAIGDKFWQRYEYHLKNPSDDALRGAVNDAYSGAFMEKLSPKLGAFAHALQKNPITKWLFPFQHIPWNIERKTIEYSPFAVLGPEMRSAILGKKGAPAQNLAIAKMTVGSSVLGYFMHKALSGDATADYPADPNDRKDWESLGIQPNSIKIVGEWVNLERLGPIGNVAHIGASLGSIIKNYNGQDDDALTSALWAGAMAAANQIGNEVGFQTLRNLFDALQSGEKRGSRFVAWQAGSFIYPSSFLSQNASFIDPYQRKAEDLISGLKYRIPFARETLLPKRDPIYGEPVPNPGYHSILRTVPVSTDKAKLEMQRLQIHPAPPEDRIGGVKLTPEMYDRYQAVAGAFTKTALDSIVNTPGWSDLPDIVRETMIRNTIHATRQTAAGAMQAANPVLIEAGIKQRVDHITGASHTARPKKAPELAVQP